MYSLVDLDDLFARVLPQDRPAEEERERERKVPLLTIRYYALHSFLQVSHAPPLLPRSFAVVARRGRRSSRARSRTWPPRLITIITQLAGVGSRTRKRREENGEPRYYVSSAPASVRWGSTLPAVNPFSRSLSLSLSRGCVSSETEAGAALRNRRGPLSLPRKSPARDSR